MGSYHQRCFRSKHRAQRLRSQIRHRRAAGVVASSHIFRRPSGSVESGGNTRSGSGDGGKERGGNRGGFNFSRILQSSFPCTQERWRVQTRNRSFGTQQVSVERDFQDGDSGIHHVVSSQGRVHNFHRPEGCVFSYSDRKVESEIYALPCRRESLSIQSSPIRTIIGTPGVYEGHGIGGGLCASSGSPDAHIPGRLAHTISLQRDDRQRHGVCSKALCVPRFDRECSQVEFGAETRLCLSGNSLSDGGVPSPAFRRPVEPPEGTDPSVSEGPIATSAQLVAPDRIADIYGFASTSRTLATPADSAEFSRWMGSCPTLSGPESKDTTSGTRDAQLVGSQVQCDVGSHDGTFQDRCDHLHGCVEVGMGRTSRLALGVGRLASCVARLCHQLAGDGSHSVGSPSLLCSDSRQTCLSHERQQDSSRVCEQTGRCPITSSLSFGQTNRHLGKTKRDADTVSLHSRSVKCNRRPVKSSTSGDRHGVVSAPIRSGSDLEALGPPSDRSFRNAGQFQTPDVCIPIPRRDSFRNGCAGDVVGRNVGLRLSSDSVSSAGIGQSQDRSCGTNIDSTMVAETSLVVRPSRAELSEAIGSSHSEKSAETTRFQHLSCEARSSQASRLETISQGVRDAGFSAKVAQRVARGKLRDSSLKVYDARWGAFSDWCRSRDLDPWSVTVHQIADFLLHLFEAKKVKVRTIEGYRSAISSTLKLSGQNIGSDPYLSSLIGSFYADRPVEPSRVPKWDLSVVLSGLTKWPFESKDPTRVSLQHLTYKTVFLISLASAARRGELHALDLTLTRWSEDRRSVTLRPRVGFMAKTHLARDPSTAYRGFTLRAMSAQMDKSDPDRTLCPVRALRFYLKRTESLRAGRRALFLPIRRTKSGTLSPATISGWIRRAILLAYQVVGKDAELRRLHSFRAHEVRALSASWDALRNVATADIMDACRWRSHNTFSTFYLRDLTELEGQLLALKNVRTAVQSRL